MAQTFIAGEKKIRPDTYFRFEKYGDSPTAGVEDGRTAVTLRSNWGPLGKVAVLENYTDIEKQFGTAAPSADITTNAALEQFRGGVRLVYAARVGTGGTSGTYTIEGDNETPMITLTLKYPGSRALSATIRPTLADPNVSELLILEGTTELEKLKFTNKNGVEDNGQNLMDAYAAQGSNYFVLTKLTYTSNEGILPINQIPIAGGTDPTVNVGAYSAAFELLSMYRWNVIALDTDDAATQLMLQLFVDRIYNDGRLTMGVVGEPTSIPFETRLSHASAFNDKQIVYVGGGYYDTLGIAHEGWLAAAYISGLIAATPSAESITHLAVTGAVSLIEPLTNNQYERAITAGMLTFSTSAADTVWVEQGVNTLVLPGTNEDIGWEKIKRVKVRFELIDRINRSVDPIIARINNDPDGRANIIQLANTICTLMVAEHKLFAGAFVELDPDNPPQGDSAWFRVWADDIDALEKAYFLFKFRYAPAADAA
jgi:hypothetical protein